MASFRSAPYVGDALRSVLGQTLRDLEVIVVDDGSDDGSRDIVEVVMRHDHRVRLFRTANNGGPARARNLGLKVARGSWVAVVDADDMVHPERFERLVAAADVLGADIVADDLLQFHEDRSPARLLLQQSVTGPLRIATEAWIRGASRLGYLKPMFRRAVLGGRRYDESLRIGEDFDLMLRLLLAGASAWVIPEPWYLYRRHAGSISRSLPAAERAALIDSQNRVFEQATTKSPAVREAFLHRLRDLEAGVRFEQLAAALKEHHFTPAAQLIADDPGQLLRLGAAFADRMARRFRARRGAAGAETGPQRLHLTERSAAPPVAAELVVVPAYLPPGIPEAGWRHRRLWRDLADRARAGELEVTYDGPAGRYAAGFIPSHRVSALRRPLARPEARAELGAT